jgi:flagellar motility protein MotE (MotC chaperone)
MALIYAIPESPQHNTVRASELLQQLILNYPRSAFAGAATLLLRQQVELQQQRAEVERLNADISRQEAQIQLLGKELNESKQVEQANLEQLRTDLTRREERIRQLSAELERLKQIDLQRRPAAPLP